MKSQQNKIELANRPGEFYSPNFYTKPAKYPWHMWHPNNHHILFSSNPLEYIQWRCLFKILHAVCNQVTTTSYRPCWCCFPFTLEWFPPQLFQHSRVEKIPHLVYSEATRDNNIEQQQQQWTLEFYSNFLCNTKMHATASHQEMLLKKFEGCQDCEKYNSFVRNTYSDCLKCKRLSSVNNMNN